MRRAPRSQPSGPRRARTLHAFLLALVLLAAQGLGLAHRALHASLAATTPGAAHGEVRPSVQAADSLFGQHAPSGAECRLYDHLAHADALPGAAAPGVEPGRVPAPTAVAAFEARGTPGAPYLARAPPRA